MSEPKEMTFDEAAAIYCERQESTIPQLRTILADKIKEYNPIGFMLLQCEVLDGSRCGELTILPYGPNNSFKEVPNHCISPRGLASDMSRVVGYFKADGLADMSWQTACQGYLDQLGAAEYEAGMLAHLFKKKKRHTYKHDPSPYHRELVELLGINDEEGFKALKAAQGYSSAMGV